MPNEKQTRGFGGFSNMVSDVSDLSPRNSGTPSEDTWGDGPSWSSHKPESVNKWSKIKAAIFCILIIGILTWGGVSLYQNLNGDQDHKPLPQIATSAGANKTSSNNQSYSPPQETVPSVGSNNVLSGSEIRYCQAQRIRLSGAEKAINNNSDYEIDTFNKMVADYNGRCSSYRYKVSVFEPIKAEVESKRQQYMNEGATQFPSGQVGPKSYR